MAKFEYKIFECRIHATEENEKNVLFEIFIDEQWKDANQVGEEGWEFIKFIHHHPEFSRVLGYATPAAFPGMPAGPLPPDLNEIKERLESWRGGLFKREKP